MPQALEPILPDTAIVKDKGKITDFFRLRWAALINILQRTPTVGAINGAGLTAALVTSNVYITKAAGQYRVSYYMRKTVADGVSSRLTATIGWSESGVALTEQEADLNADSVTAGQQSFSKLMQCDAASAITLGVTYASNTPAKMTWLYWAVVEFMA